ncbi:MAG: hypothetical protein HY556_05745 [Euryarchaeota archaeon]|nr:hypothetical protein [Euryarchaeota archaeon]
MLAARFFLLIAAALLLTGCTSPPGPPTDDGEDEEDAKTGGEGDGGIVHWSTRAALPTPRSELSCASIGDKVYAVAGSGEAGTPSTGRKVEVYDARSDTWSAGPDLPVAVDHSSLVAHNGTLYLFGGYEGGSPSTIAASWKVATEAAWRVLDALPRARAAHAAAVVEDRIYVVGGLGASGLIGEVDVYSPDSGQWSVAPALPTPRDHLSAGSFDVRLFVAGGRKATLSSNLDTLQVLDTRSLEWKEAARMPTARGGLAGAMFGGLFFTLGGERPDGVHAEVEVYNAGLDTWASYTKMPTARHGLCAAGTSEELVVVGGGISQASSRDAFHVEALSFRPQ